MLQHLLNAGASFPSRVEEDEIPSLTSEVRHHSKQLIFEKLPWLKGYYIVEKVVSSFSTLKSLMEFSIPFVMEGSVSDWIEAFMLCDGEVFSTEVHQAVIRGKIAFLNAVLPRWKNKFWNHDECGKTPLHYAAELGRAGIIPILIRAGYSLEDTDFTGGNRPLFYALMNGRLHVLDMLSPNQHAVEEERMRIQRRTEILAAIEMEDLPKLEEVFGVGVHLSFVKKDATAKSAFRHAVLNDYVLITELILSNRVYPLVQNPNDRVPYE